MEKRSQEEIAVVRIAQQNAGDESARQRLYALELYMMSETVKSISQKTNLTEGIVYQLIKKYKQVGIEQFTANVPQSRPRCRFSQSQIAEIDKALENCSDPRIKKRLLALKLRADGMSCKEIAKEVGISKVNVSNLSMRYQNAGLHDIMTYRRRPAERHYFPEIPPQEIEEISAALDCCQNEQIKKRLTALKLRAEGASSKEAATASGFGRDTVSHIVKKYFEFGLDAVLSEDYYPKTPPRQIEWKKRKKCEKTMPVAEKKETEQDIALKNGLLELSEALEASTEERERHRLLGLKLRAEGMKNVEAAKMAGIDVCTLSRQVRKYIDHGITSILAKSTNSKNKQ